MKRHPTDGTLRRLVDEPDGVPAADRAHVAACPSCQTGVALAGRDAAQAATLLDLPVTPDVAEGWRRLAAATTDTRPATAVAGRGLRTALRSPVIAVAAVAALVAGAGVAAATDWLPIFRAEGVVPVTASEADLVSLPDLSAFGDLRVTERVDVREAADAAAAEQATGLSVPQVARLPRGVTGQPVYRVSGRVSAEFTFSAAKAGQAAVAAGRALPPVPGGLDGSRFRLTAGPGLMAVWSKGRGVPSLVLARAVAPTVYTSGVPFGTARDYLLSLPMLPEDVAAQLRAFTGDGTTLPLIVPGERMTGATADVNGVPATVLTSRNGVMSAVVWVHEGAVTALAGSLSPDELLSAARELRWGR